MYAFAPCHVLVAFAADISVSLHGSCLVADAAAAAAATAAAGATAAAFTPSAAAGATHMAPFHVPAPVHLLLSQHLPMSFFTAATAMLLLVCSELQG